MTLFLKVQMAIELNNNKQGLKLPKNYPVGWHNNDDRNAVFSSYKDQEDDKSESSSFLNLTSSRLQTDVG